MQPDRIRIDIAYAGGRTLAIDATDPRRLLPVAVRWARRPGVRSVAVTLLRPGAATPGSPAARA